MNRFSYQSRKHAVNEIKVTSLRSSSISPPISLFDVFVVMGKLNLKNQRNVKNEKSCIVCICKQFDTECAFKDLNTEKSLQ